MISIIICTLEEEIKYVLSDNIEKTIGVDYEVIYIYNENNKYSIFEAYNLGVSKAKFSICCFMHDDIIYQTFNWGAFVVEYFEKNKDLGAIAVAGCKYLRKMPSIWSIPKYNVFNIIQSDKKNKVKYWLNDSKAENIIVFDGMWFCIRKSLFDIIEFDKITYDGFHFYDLDIAMQIYIAGFKIKSVPNILIEHTSMGYLDRNWLKNAFKFYSKWSFFLPVSLVQEDKNLFISLEDSAIISMLRTIKNEKAYSFLKPWFFVSISVKGNIFRFTVVMLRFLFSFFNKNKKYLTYSKSLKYK